MRITSQFEEGQHFLAYMIQLPNKSKLPTGQVRVHVQNRRFSLTHGIPPKLVHSWDLVDLRYVFISILLQKIKMKSQTLMINE